MNDAIKNTRGAVLDMICKEAVTVEDVATLKRCILADRPLSRVELDDLFALDGVAKPQCDAWTEFFVEVATNYIVWDQRPTGVLEEAQARWLIEKVDSARTASCFALLINILEEADRLPRWFESAVRERATAGWPSLAWMMSAEEDGRLARAA